VLDKDALIFEAGDIADDLIIVQSGRLELFTMMDNGTELTVEYSIAGSVINYTKFLINDFVDLSARALGKTNTFYSVDRATF